MKTQIFSVCKCRCFQPTVVPFLVMRKIKIPFTKNELTRAKQNGLTSHMLTVIKSTICRWCAKSSVWTGTSLLHRQVYIHS